MTQITKTPLMKQYEEMKKKYPDAILLFRVGDFYETWGEDAITCNEILNITLTRRANGSAKAIELAGFPHYALDTYLPRLVRAGKRVAICEQLEDPKRKSTTKLSNGLLIGPKVELTSKGFHDIDGRFMIHNGKVGIFLSEPNNKWYFAPLVLTHYDEERYKLYTELSWQYSEWIWIDEYDEEKLPEYYEEMMAMYHRFVEKYGPLHAPENAAFIKLDAYADNLDILEKKVINKDGKIQYIPGEGFEKIETSLRGYLGKLILRPFFGLLTTFSELIDILFIFEEIRRKTQEIHSLARRLRISPKKAFQEYSIMPQPSLFD